MRKWVIAFLLVAMLAACSEAPAENPSEPVVESPTPVETPAATETAAPEASPIIEEPTEGRLVITIKDKPVKKSDVESLTFALTEVQLHEEETGAHVWKEIGGNESRFNLTEIGETERVFVDKMVPVGKYSQLKFLMGEVSAVVDKTSYSVNVPDGRPLILGIIDVRPGKTATVTLDFNIEKSLHIVNERAHFHPIITVTTRRGATATIENLTATIAGGDILTDREQSINLTYPLGILNASRIACREKCATRCADQEASCEGNCDEEVFAGCQSDEEYCRRICEPLIHPSYCKYGCGILNGDDPEINDTVDACEDYLSEGCAESCNQTRESCDSICIKECV